MKRIGLLAVGLALGAAAPVIGDGTLVAPPLDGFVTGFNQSNARVSILEEVPRGETVEKWTRMVTTQQFLNVPAQLTPQAILQGLTRSLPARCPGATTTEVATVIVSGHNGARMRADCSRNPQTGLPETFLMIAVQGPSDLHIKQAAFRRVPDRSDLAWAEGVLGMVTFCTPGDRAPGCGG
jgi:hypothetical protein